MSNGSIKSIVISKIDDGKYIASLRFDDSSLDRELSSINKNKLYKIIENNVFNINRS